MNEEAVNPLWRLWEDSQEKQTSRWPLEDEKGLTGSRSHRQRTERTQRHETGERGTRVGNTWLEGAGRGISACGIGLCQGQRELRGRRVAFRWPQGAGRRQHGGASVECTGPAGRAPRLPGCVSRVLPEGPEADAVPGVSGRDKGPKRARLPEKIRGRAASRGERVPLRARPAAPLTFHSRLRSPQLPQPRTPPHTGRVGTRAWSAPERAGRPCGSGLGVRLPATPGPWHLQRPVPAAAPSHAGRHRPGTSTPTAVPRDPARGSGIPAASDGRSGNDFPALSLTPW